MKRQRGRSTESGVKHVENQLEQVILQLYDEGLGFQPNQVTCQLVGDSHLMINFEDNYSKAETVLRDVGKYNLANTVHSQINKILAGRIFAQCDAIRGLVVDEIGWVEQNESSKLTLYSTFRKADM